MPTFAELEQRITSLCDRAAARPHGSRLFVDIEDLLAEGELCARRETIAGEDRVVFEDTLRLRRKLALMRQHWVALGSERIGLR